MPDLFLTPVREIMTTTVRVVRDLDPIGVAARVLVDNHFGGLPVTSLVTGEVVGVLSWCDAMRAMSEWTKRGVSVEGGNFYDPMPPIIVGDLAPLEAADGAVLDYMSTRLVAVSTSATVRDAARLMAKAEVHRVLVIGDDDRLAGIVSSFDVVRLVAA